MCLLVESDLSIPQQFYRWAVCANSQTASNFYLKSSLNYKTNDGSNHSNEATVSIGVNRGNLNDDDSRNILDVVIGLQIATTAVGPTLAQVIAGDPDNNTLLDVIDANMNLEHMTGLNEAITFG